MNALYRIYVHQKINKNKRKARACVQTWPAGRDSDGAGPALAQQEVGQVHVAAVRLLHGQAHQQQRRLGRAKKKPHAALAQRQSTRRYRASTCTMCARCSFVLIRSHSALLQPRRVNLVIVPHKQNLACSRWRRWPPSTPGWSGCTRAP